MYFKLIEQRGKGIRKKNRIILPRRKHCQVNLVSIAIVRGIQSLLLIFMGALYMDCVFKSFGHCLGGKSFEISHRMYPRCLRFVNVLP